MDEIEEAMEKYKGLVPLVYDIEIMSLVEARPQDMPYAVYLKREVDKVIANQKYKRCLAMVCRCKSEYVHRKSLSDKEQWYWRRWYIKWLELAEKFKEMKR